MRSGATKRWTKKYLTDSARGALGRTMCTAKDSPPSESADAATTIQTQFEKKEETSSSKSKSSKLHQLRGYSDDEVVDMVMDGKVSQYKLEREIKKSIMAGNEPDCERAVRIRRLWLKKVVEGNRNSGDKTGNEKEGALMRSMSMSTDVTDSSRGLPFQSFDVNNFYQQVLGKNCENVVGFVPMPVGFVGPLKLDEKEFYVPLATTEGALVASTNRGCRAITESGGATSSIFSDAMSRAPVFKLPTAAAATEIKNWLDTESNFTSVKDAFEETTNYGKLKNIKAMVAGRNLFLRFECSTGDAMGMNMVSKGVMAAVAHLEKTFPSLKMVAVSGNACTDKKPSAINWVEGRGKGVVAETVLTGQVIVDVLKCSVDSLVEVNMRKNLVGSAIAGSIGGNNAHASNIVTAAFMATGQDPAQNVESSSCMTLMEPVNDGQDLHISVTMPCVEVGTVGGGTGLSAQRACLELLGVAGANHENPGENARNLARIIGATVLAGEISLMSALASNHLVSAHMKLNR